MTPTPAASSGPAWLPRAEAVVAISLALVFIGLALTGARQAYSPVPFWDMWDGYIGFYMDASNGLEAWWRQHNEHRIVLARMLFWIDITWFGGSAWLLIVINYLLAGLTFGLLAVGGLAESSLPRPMKLALAAVITGLGFAWSQSNNLGWGFQSQFYLAQLLPLAALMALERSGRPQGAGAAWFIAAMLLGLMAVGSMANGLLTLFLLAGMARIGKLGIARVLIPALLGAAAAFVYFRGYTSPSGHGSVLASLTSDPWGVLVYMFTYLGSPYAYIFGAGGSRVGIATVAGAVVALLSVVVVCRSVFQTGRQQMDVPLVLSVFLVYLGASALAIAGSRAGFGLESAIASRYTTPALLVSCTLLVSFARYAYVQRREVAGHAATLFGIALLALLLPFQASATKDQGLVGFEKMVAALSLELGVRDQAQMQWIFPSADWALQIAERAAAANVSIFAHPLLLDGAETIGKTAPALPGKLMPCGTAAPLELAALEGETRFVSLRGAISARAPFPEPLVVMITDGQDRVVGRGLLAGVPADEDGNSAAPFRAYLLADAAGASYAIRVDALGCQIPPAAP